jgi:hypothetical protein
MPDRRGSCLRPNMPQRSSCLPQTGRKDRPRNRHCSNTGCRPNPRCHPRWKIPVPLCPTGSGPARNKRQCTHMMRRLPRIGGGEWRSEQPWWVALCAFVTAPRRNRRTNSRLQPAMRKGRNVSANRCALHPQRHASRKRALPAFPLDGRQCVPNEGLTTRKDCFVDGPPRVPPGSFRGTGPPCDFRSSSGADSAPSSSARVGVRAAVPPA